MIVLEWHGNILVIYSSKLCLMTETANKWKANLKADNTVDTFSN